MKKVLNASLLATAVAMSFGANAATIIVDPTNTMTLSEEGVSVGVTHTGQVIFDTVLGAPHNGTTEIVLTFGADVDLSLLTAGPTSCGAPISGTFTCGEVTFNVGNGNFTFDAVTVDAVASTITYTVSLGNTITSGSSYRTTIGDGGGTDPVVADAFSVNFESTLGGSQVDIGSGVVATKAPQFAATIATQTDGVIERTARLSFLAPEGTPGWESYSLTYTNDLTLLAPAVVAASASVTDTSLTNVVLHVPSAVDGWSSSLAAGTVLTVPQTVPGTLDGDIVSSYVIGSMQLATFTDVLTFNRTAGMAAPNVLEVSDFDVDFTVNFSGPDGVGTKDVLKTADAGEWALDAAVINVPYLPVGYGLSPNVEVANDSVLGMLSEVIIEGFDDKGNVYAPVTLAKTANGKTVTKISEADIMTAFQITGKAKLSVTFIIDADADKVTLAPYYRQNESRVNVMSDQYKADAIR